MTPFYERFFVTDLQGKKKRNYSLIELKRYRGENTLSSSWYLVSLSTGLRESERKRERERGREKDT